MRFRQLEKTSRDTSIAYEIEDKDGKKVGSFSAHRRGSTDFWIDRITWNDSETSSGKLQAILEFIRYKAGVSGCSNIYIRVSVKNYGLQQRLQNFGFYRIDEETNTGNHGEEICTCVWKLVNRIPDRKS